MFLLGSDSASCSGSLCSEPACAAHTQCCCDDLQRTAAQENARFSSSDLKSRLTNRKFKLSKTVSGGIYKTCSPSCSDNFLEKKEICQTAKKSKLDNKYMGRYIVCARCTSNKMSVKSSNTNSRFPNFNILGCSLSKLKFL